MRTGDEVPLRLLPHPRDQEPPRATTLLARIIDIKCTRIVDAHIEKDGLRVDVVPTT